jgi:serine/threonine protein kinase
MSAQDQPEMIGSYEILSELGRGAVGVVYKARHRELDRLVALKVVREEDVADTADLERFIRGAKAAAKLNHPHIVRVYQVGRNAEVVYAAMALVEGLTLRQKVREGPMSAADCKQMLEKLVDALGHAHAQGVVHRNLNPDSILFDKSGLPRITGFGTARLTSPGHSITTVTNEASFDTAPEFITGGDTSSPLVDVYGLGTVLYTAMTGKSPFEGVSISNAASAIVESAPISPRKVNSKVTKELEAICLRCLAKNPKERFDSAASIFAEVSSNSTKSSLAVPVESAKPQAKQSSKRSLGIAAALIILIAILGYVGYRSTLTENYQPEEPGSDVALTSAPSTSATEVSLFNGKDLSGWDVVGPKVWKVENDTIMTTAPESDFSALATSKEYSDFELTLEYKLTPTTDTGIYLRMNFAEDVVKYARKEIDFFIELQLLGSQAIGTYRTGSIWDNTQPTNAPIAPDNEWNRVFIRAVGKQLTVKINDTLCIDKAISFPRLSGVLALQSWKSSSSFRNIKIIDLGGTTKSIVAPATNDELTPAEKRFLLVDLPKADLALSAKGGLPIGEFDWAACVNNCEAAFKGMGFEFGKGSAVLRQALEGRPEVVKSQYLLGLEAWEMAADAIGKRAFVDELRVIQTDLDDDPWRNRLRTVRANPGAAGVFQLATEAINKKMPEAEQYRIIQILLFRKLLGRPESLVYFRELQKQLPNFFWANFGLAICQIEAAKKLNGEARATQFEAAFGALRNAKRIRPQALAVDEAMKLVEAEGNFTESDEPLAMWVFEKSGRVLVSKVGETAVWQEIPCKSSDTLPKESFRVVGISLADCKIEDTDLESIKGVRSLKEVYLQGTNVSDTGVRKLRKQNPSIDCLNLENTKVTDVILDDLKGLKSLYLRDTGITDQAIKKYAGANTTTYVLHSNSTITKPIVSERAANGHVMHFDWDSWVELPISLNLTQPATIEGIMTLPPEIQSGECFPIGLFGSNSIGRLDIGITRPKTWKTYMLMPVGSGRALNLSNTEVMRPTHFASVFDGNDLSFYVDGKRQGEIKGVTFAKPSKALCAINGIAEGFTSTRRFNGLIREVRFSSIARYTKDFVPVNRHEPDEHTVGLYHLDEGEGDSVKDSSGKNQHGKIINPRWLRAGKDK